MLGKGVFIWQGSSISKGDLGALVDQISAMGLSHVLIKIGDATTDHSRSYPDMSMAVTALRQIKGLQIFGWHYVYGGGWIDRLGGAHFDGPSPESEAIFAKNAVRNLGLDGYAIDAEREFKLGWNDPDPFRNNLKRASRFMGTLKGIGVPTALCAYRFPKLHPDFPWDAFLPGSAYHMPQVYWGNYQNASVSELDTSYTQLKALKDMPFVPVGRAYVGDGHSGERPKGTPVISGEISLFLTEARRLSMFGASFWALDFINYHPHGEMFCQAITDFDWTVIPPPPPPPLVSLPYRVKTWVYLGLNVRSGPGTQYPKIGLMRAGQIFQFLLQSENGWYKIDYQGQNAWVSAQYVEPVLA